MPQRRSSSIDRHHRHGTLALWGWPVALGLLSASGLVSALVSDDWGDAWSWVALGVPVAVMAWCVLRRQRARPSGRSPRP